MIIGIESSNVLIYNKYIFYYVKICGKNELLIVLLIFKAELPAMRDLTSEEINALVKERGELLQGTGTIGTINYENLPCFVPYNLITQHSIPDKSIADCVEALIGKYKFHSVLLLLLPFILFVHFLFLSRCKFNSCVCYFEVCVR